jgi:hypothetical protein
MLNLTRRNALLTAALQEQRSACPSVPFIESTRPARPEAGKGFRPFVR